MARYAEWCHLVNAVKTYYQPQQQPFCFSEIYVNEDDVPAVESCSDDGSKDGDKTEDDTKRHGGGVRIGTSSW